MRLLQKEEDKPGTSRGNSRHSIHVAATVSRSLFLSVAKLYTKRELCTRPIFAPMQCAPNEPAVFFSGRRRMLLDTSTQRCAFAHRHPILSRPVSLLFRPAPTDRRCSVHVHSLHQGCAWQAATPVPRLSAYARLRVNHRKTSRRRAVSREYSRSDVKASEQQRDLDTRILWLLLPAMASVFLDPLMALTDTGMRMRVPCASSQELRLAHAQHSPA